MAAPYTTLTMTGGSATRDLVDGVNYSLLQAGWPLAVSTKRRSNMASIGPYEDMSEQITINVLGSTGAEAHANLGALANDLYQAARWKAGEDVPAVLLNLQVQGSDPPKVLSVPIWGGDIPLGLPATYNDLLMIYEIGPVAINFNRFGAWLHPAHDTDNPITNSSFELGSGTPTSWSVDGSPTITQPGDNVVHGSKSVRIVGVGSIYMDISGLTAAAVYTLSVYTNPTTGTARLRAYDGGGFTNAVTVDATAGSGLQRLSLQKTCPGSGSIRVELRSTTGGGVAYFDAVLLELGSAASAYHPKDSEVFTAVSSTVANPEIMTADFAVSGVVSQLPSPIKVELVLDAAQVLDLQQSFLVLVSGDDDGNFALVNAETLTATNFTSVADATNNAVNGSVLRFTPPDTAEYVSGDISGTTGYHRLAFIATARNNDITQSYRLKVRASQYANANYTETEEIIIDNTTTEEAGEVPVPFYLGMLDGLSLYQDIRLVVQASATGGSLDIDSLFVIPLYDEGVYILKLDAVDTGAVTADGLVLDSAALISPEPKVYAAQSTSEEFPVGVAGDDFLTMVGSSVKAALIVCEGTDWRATGGGSLDMSMLVTRQLAYLTPE